MKTLLLGATGATGGPLIGELIKRNRQVKALVRTPESIPAEFQTHPDLEVIPGSISDLPVDEFAQHLEDCDSAVSCLGHNLSFKGMFGPPYRLVTDAVRKLTEASLTLDRDGPLKLILMGSAGVSNRDLNEPVSAAQRCVIALLKALLPPHADNEAAADFLRTRAVNHPNQVEWAVVRPDNLINASEVTDYELHPSPIRSAIFDSGTTSRINVADFMAELIHDEKLWSEWKGKMPVIYNARLSLASTGTAAELPPRMESGSRTWLMRTVWNHSGDDASVGSTASTTGSSEAAAPSPFSTEKSAREM